MKGFEKLDDSNIEHLYELASQLVSSWADPSNNPEIQLAPFARREVGEQALTVEIINIRSGLKNLMEKNIALQRLLPDAELDTEDQPNGKARYFIHIPIWTPKSQRRSHTLGTSMGFTETKGRPSTEWLMFLIMIDSVLSTILYFRW